MQKEKKHKKIEKIENNFENKYNSRKLFFALLILLMSFIPVLAKFNDEMFLEIFKQWCWLALGTFAIYTGGNIGEKFSRKKLNNSYIYDNNGEEFNEELDNDGI